MYQTISIADFAQLISTSQVAMIDVREPEEYQMGHIKDTQLMPLQTLPAHLATLDKAPTYYVICQSGGRSGMACEYLANQGFQVVNVLTGMSGWQGPTVTGL